MDVYVKGADPNRVYTGVKSECKCVKCGKIISVTLQYETEDGFAYETHDTADRFVDKWGHAKNFCKACANEAPRKDAFIQFRCTQADKDAIELKAQQAGKTISQYIIDNCK